MDLREQILKEHSRDHADRIVKWVGKSQTRFDELFNLFLNNEYRVTQRAAWPLSDIVIKHPTLIEKHFSKFIKNLDNPDQHAAVKRNTVRVLEQIEIPPKYHGRIMDACFRFISSNQETVAVKAYSIGILANLSKRYPEINQEIKLVIEERWNIETPAFKSRAKKFLRLMDADSKRVIKK